jgi:hypothetical protein
MCEQDLLHSLAPQGGGKIKTRSLKVQESKENVNVIWVLIFQLIVKFLVNFGKKRRLF